jgi:hypothetical protein
MNRREFTVGAGATLVATPAWAAEPLSAWWLPPKIEKPTKPQRATSLRGLVQKARLGEPARLNLTRIEGYTVADSDVILWGKWNPKDPELLFDDFVVAVRSGQGAYPGGTMTLVSWEKHLPPEEWIKAFQEIRKRKDRTAAEEFCGYKKVARIEGLPSDNDTTNALLVADSAMKDAFEGFRKLKIQNPFKSAVVDGRMVEWRMFLKNKLYPTDVPQVKAAFKNTFGGRVWFSPGKIDYLWDPAFNAQTAFLTCMQIVHNVVMRSLTEIEPDYLDQSVRDCSCNWTNRMDDIVQSEPVWQRLDAIYRWFAIASIIKKHRSMVFKATLDDTSFIWKDYQLPRVTLVKHTPFLRQETYDGLRGSKWQFEYYCGGVSLDCKPRLASATDDSLALARDVVLSSRPRNEYSWNI